MKKLFLVLIMVLFAANAFAADVTLTWDANTEPDLAGYKVYTGTNSGNYDAPVDVGNVTEYTMTDLQDGVFHYFVLTAYDNETPSLESDYSNEVMCSNNLPPGTVINIIINCNANP